MNPTRAAATGGPATAREDDMDVAAPRLPDAPRIPDPTWPTGPRLVRRSPAPEPGREGGGLASDPGRADQRWTPPSTLKSTLRAADVTAKFEIQERTRRVIVTMLDRNTGEVLNEVPSRRLLDQIAALAAIGLQVDARS